MEVEMWRPLLALFLVVLLGPAAHTEAVDRQYVISAVDLELRPGTLDKFLDAVKENAAATAKEPGNRQYVVSQSTENPNQILLLEVYDSAEAVQAHRNSEHFKKYMATTKDLVAKRQSRPMKSVAFFSK
jgi:(4S)-4-hydroxy-5-phosphonooxypentane-2,3-dione isomerase